MDAELMDIGRTKTSVVPCPLDPAPPHSAPYEVRADWSGRYVAWFIAQTPQEGFLPSDVEPTHRYQVEFNSCVIDPPEYERDTSVELAPQMVH